MLQERSHELVQSLCQNRSPCPQRSVLRMEVGGRAVGSAAVGRMMGLWWVLHFHPPYTEHLSHRTLKLYVPIRQFYDLIHPD